MREFEIEIKRCSVIIHSCLQTKHFALQNVQFLIPGLLFRHSIIPALVEIIHHLEVSQTSVDDEPSLRLVYFGFFCTEV